LAVGHRDLLRRVVQDDARGRRRVQQRRVGPGRSRGGERRYDHCRDERASPHASARFPEPATTPTIETRSATPATASATIPRIDEEPPSDDFASIVGAGVSELSGPLQSTIEPSAQVWRTFMSYVLLSFGLARQWKAVTSPVVPF